jgi:hypothetical protein
MRTTGKMLERSRRCFRHGRSELQYRQPKDYEFLLRFYGNGAWFRQLDEIPANVLFGGVSDRN